jgi:hypothetical protein
MYAQQRERERERERCRVVYSCHGFPTVFLLGRQTSSETTQLGWDYWKPLGRGSYATSQPPENDHLWPLYNEVFSRAKSRVRMMISDVLSLTPRLCEMFRNEQLFKGGGYKPLPNTQAGGTPTVGCPRLLTQYIRSYPKYLDVVSTRNLRTRHAVVTADPLNMVLVGKAEVKRQIGRPRRKWEDRIRMDLREMAAGGVDSTG